MSKEILNLEPKTLWKNFYDLTQVPRPSKHEDKIQEFVYNFGKGLGFETIKDEVGNIIIRKPATLGMEDRKGVVLQGHLDMVPQKNSDKVHDFKTDPIDAYIDGDWVTANGTTLGADNGMGVAATMSILESTDIPHGPIEALFTSDEETGMTGAFGLKPGILKGDILMNLDSEDEGELYIGCAGGIDATVTVDFEKEDTPAGMTPFKLALTGLKGGHSGLEIILYRGNSNKLLFRFIKAAIEHYDMRVASLNGGSLRNAIPRESFATVVVPTEKKDKFVECVAKFEAMFTAELSGKETDISFKALETKMPEKVMDKLSVQKITDFVYAAPNGVIRMSDAMENMVETSTNLAIVQSKGNKVTIAALMRSFVETAKDDLGEMFTSLARLAGFEIELAGAYPGWKPNPDSVILTEMQKIYNNKFGNVPEIKAIHAGLECGLLGSVYPNWDMISFGPTIRFPHSPDEKVKIDTVKKFYDFLVETLKEIPKK